ncbi:type VII secretion target [Mycobacterium sp. DL592]|uniref:type VII secretion target n=1 Tax=Mycobacterium sp. DL592 TaxID=2675524 RepID=UPI001424861B|nr:type VII secretion target [Mycobacterium sp. DL592]
MGTTRVDTAAAHAAAQRFTAAAQLLETAARTGGLSFSGSTAGRAHAASGERLHAALDEVRVQLAQWSRAAEEVAAALRAGAQQYADAELRAAAVLR